MLYLLVVRFAVGRMSRPLGPRRRWLSRRPVSSNAARSKPLSVHRSDSRLGFALLDKRYECVSLALQCLRVSDDPAVADLAEGSKGLLQRLRFNLRREITDKYVMVIARVELGLITRTRRPVNLHLLLEEGAFVHGGQRGGRALMVGELDEGIRVVARLADDLASFDGTDLRE